MVEVVTGCLLEILYVGLDLFFCSKRLTKMVPMAFQRMTGLSRGQEVIFCGGLVIFSARSLIVNPSSLLMASLSYALMFRRSWSL